MVERNLDEKDLRDAVQYARDKYGQWLSRVKAHEHIYWTENYSVPHDIDDGEIEIVRPAKAKNIQRKVMSMLAIRSEQTIKITAPDTNVRTIKKVDRAEKFLQGYRRAQRRTNHTSADKDGAWFTTYYGRGGIMSQYVPNGGRSNLCVYQEAVDPRTTFPFYSPHGIEWVVRDYYKPRRELAEYFGGIDQERVDYPVPDLWRPTPFSKSTDLLSTDSISVVEYWDQKYHSFLIDDFWLVKEEHGYGFVPYTERRINSTPLEEIHLQSEGLLGAAANSIETYYKLMAKLATAVEQFFYPRVMIKTENGELVVVDSASPGAWGTMGKDAEPIILNPSPNYQTNQQLMNMLREEIEQSTIPQVAFTTDLPGASGFQTSQVLTLIQDALADYIDPLQDMFADSLGHVNKLHYLFAEYEPGGVVQMPIAQAMGDMTVRESYTKEDFEGMDDVSVNIRPALPTDKLQNITMLNQLMTMAPDGRPIMPPEWALKVSGMEDYIPDMAAMMERRDEIYAVMNDPDLQQKELAAIRARMYPDEKQMDRDIKAAQKKRETTERQEAEKAALDGMTGEVLVPKEALSNPQVLQQMLQLTQMGQDPMLALEQEPLQAMGGAPQQGQPQGQAMGGGEDISDVLGALMGQQAPEQQPQGGPEIANGLTGYGGSNSMVLPPAAQGGQPRQVVDRPNVAVEQMDERMRRGAKPPPR